MYPPAGFPYVFPIEKQKSSWSLIHTKGKGDSLWEGGIRKIPIIVWGSGSNSNNLEAQSAPIAASSVCSVARPHDQVILFEANTAWGD